MGKIVIKPQHIEEFEKEVDSILSSFQRADFEQDESRKVIVGMIIKRIKRILKIAN